MDTSATETGEALLRAWLDLTAAICSRRMVTNLTLNEAVVCNHLLHQRETDPDHFLTATELCARTGLLKSQMNQILSSLEQQGCLTRTRSESDRRQVYLVLTDAGAEAYERAHVRPAALLSELVRRMGADAAKDLTAQLEQCLSILRDIRAEERRDAL